MLPTGLGFKALFFYGVLLVAFYATPYQNLFFLLLSFLTVLGLLTPVWTSRNLVGVRGEVQEMKPSPAGVGAPIEVAVRAGSRRRFLLSCWLELDGRRVLAAECAELRGEHVMVGRLPPLPRGIHRVESAWLRSSYPLGLLCGRRGIAALSHVVIYPEPADLGDAHSRSEVLASLCGSSSLVKGDPGPAALRDYRAGDEPRHVHWKATARRGRLVVREWEGEAAPGFEVCLDQRAAREDLEGALSWIAALALWAREHKEILLLSSQDHHGCYGEGHRPWDELLTYLAGVLALPFNGPPPPPVAPSVLCLPAAVSPSVSMGRER